MFKYVYEYNIFSPSILNATHLQYLHFIPSINKKKDKNPTLNNEDEQNKWKSIILARESEYWKKAMHQTFY